MTARRLLLVLCALASLALIACGGSDSSTDAPATITAPTASGSVDVCAVGAGAPPVVSTVTHLPTPEVTASTGVAARSALPLVEFQRQSGGSVCLPTEVVPRNEFSIGLSGRYELADRGMMFYFGIMQKGAFWMKNTHVNLSIAFIGLDSKIVDIREMTAESLENIIPVDYFFFAVEAQPDWYQRNNVAVGDTVVLKFDLPPEFTKQP